jgi:hypothetical protein
LFSEVETLLQTVLIREDKALVFEEN